MFGPHDSSSAVIASGATQREEKSSPPAASRARGRAVTGGFMFVWLLAAAGLVHSAPHSPEYYRKLSLEELFNLEVTTVTRTRGTVAESAAAIHVITPEDIRRSGAQSVAELFRMVPGMSVARIDNNKWATGARGFNTRFQDKLLVQIDGRTIYNPLFSGVYWDAVDYPLADIERIEVVRGPGGSVWGANAVNGVINVLTKSAQDTQGGRLSAGGGSAENRFASFRFGGMISDTLFYRVYGKAFRSGPQFALTGSTDDDWRSASSGVRVDWHPGPRDTLTFDAGYLESVASRRDLRPTTNPASRVQIGGATYPNTFLNVEDERTNAAHVLSRWNHQRDEKSGLILQLYWNRLQRRFEGLPSSRNFDTSDVDFQQHFRFGDSHKLLYGIGYRFSESLITDVGDHGFIASYRRPNRRTQLFSAFVQDEITAVRDRLRLVLGAKFEHNEFTGVEVQPTGRLLWTPDARQTAWAAVSRAVRSPNISEDDLVANHSLPVALGPPNFPAGSIGFPELRGNPDFASEVLIAYELGYRVRPSNRFSVDLALFWHDYDRLRTTVASSPTSQGFPAGQFALPVQWQNRMQGETYGAEIAVDGRVGERWRLYGAYTFLEMQLHRDPGLPASAEAAEGQSPEQQVYVRSSWDLPHGMEFDLGVRYVDAIRGFNPSNPNDATVPNRIGEYIAFDVRLGWQPRENLELSVVGQNLLDRHHPESGTSATVRSPLVEIRRAIYGKVTWRF